MLNKKSQGMSMNIIVVAGIALIILVVLVVIFVGRSGQFVSVEETLEEECVMYVFENEVIVENQTLNFTSSICVPRDVSFVPVEVIS